MDTRKVTYENVAAAAQALTDAGQTPSVRTIKTALGGGSPNAILPLLNQWKQARPAVQTLDISIDPQIGQLIARQIGAAVADAVRVTEQKLSEIQADADAISEAGREAEKAAQTLAEELEMAKAKLQQQAGQLEERGREIEQVRESALASVAGAESKAKRERELAESVRQELVRAQIRTEAIPRLESEIDSLTSRLQKAEADLAAARQAEAVASARAESATDRSVELAARLSKAEEQTEKVRADLAATQEREWAAMLAAQKSSDELAAVLKTVQAKKDSSPAP